MAKSFQMEELLEFLKVKFIYTGEIKRDKFNKNNK